MPVWIVIGAIMYRPLTWLTHSSFSHHRAGLSIRTTLMRAAPTWDRLKPPMGIPQASKPR